MFFSKFAIFCFSEKNFIESCSPSQKKAVDPEIIPSDQDLKDAKAPSSRYVPPGRAAPANAWGVVGGGGKIDLNNQVL